MRYDAPFLVKRYAPIFGHPNSARRVTVAYQEYRLTDAIEWARYTNERASNQPRFGPTACWIERRGQPATRRAS
jgi:hypothetical protein